MAGGNSSVRRGVLCDLTGQVFGRLTVTAFSHKSKRNGHGWRTYWVCACDCGNISTVLGSNLKSGSVRTCGCRKGIERRKRDRGKKADTLSKTREYVAWQSMIHRCYNPKMIEYPRYGGRGIRVCDKWKNSFSEFLSDVGPAPSNAHQIDRYPNNDGDYEPGNVRWATCQENNRNRRSNRLITHNGQTRCLQEWADILSVKRQTLSERIRRWGVDKAMEYSVDHCSAIRTVSESMEIS